MAALLILQPDVSQFAQIWDGTFKIVSAVLNLGMLITLLGIFRIIGNWQQWRATVDDAAKTNKTEMLSQSGLLNKLENALSRIEGMLTGSNNRIPPTDQQPRRPP